MRKTPLSTVFVALAIPFLLICGGLLLLTERPAIGVPPCYKSVVCDTTKNFSDEKLKTLEASHKTMLEKYDVDFRILTGNMTPSETINFFKVAEVGKQSKSHFGVLLMVDTQSDLVRFLASSGLESVYPKSFVSYIERTQMKPFFKANLVSTGILETAEVIVARTQDGALGKPFVEGDIVSKSPADFGAENTLNASLAAANVQFKSTEGTRMRDQDIPKPTEIVAQYHRVLAEGNTAYNLDIYSKPSQMVLRNKPLTPRQMRSELAAYQNCQIYKEVILNKNMAAVLYNVEQRQCAPYLLIFKSGGWRLDLITKANHILLNEKGEWYLNSLNDFAFSDAFLDWNFNKDGYPYPMQKMRWGLLIESDFSAMVTYIKKIYDGTPATNMPFQERDVILEWDGMKNPVNKDVMDSMNRAEKGQKMNVLLWRNGHKLSVEIKAPPKLE